MSQEAAVGAGRWLPTGTVTILRTDVEGSMRFVRELGGAWDELNAAHIELIRRSVSRLPSNVGLGSSTTRPPAGNTRAS